MTDPLDITIPAPGVAMRAMYDFTPGMRFLNHGSYGAVARPIKAVQEQWRLTIDQNPDAFIRDQWPAIWDAARLALGAFVGANTNQLGLVSNATAGLQAAAMAAPLKPGQTILATSHIYTALRNILRYVCQLRGTTLKIIDIPLAADAGDHLLAALGHEITQNVGLMVVDHITSPTALRLPVEQVVTHCRDAGVPVLVDGAHGPGFEALNISELNADWYVGDAHKWLGAARGTAFIWCHEDWLATTETPIISDLYGHGFEAAYCRYGTIDFSAWSSLPAVIQWYRQLERAGAFSHARTLMVQHISDIIKALDAAPVTPIAAPGMMATMLLPPRYTADMMDPLRLVLQRDHNVIAVFVPWADNRLLARLSTYGYSEAADLNAYREAMINLQN